MADALVSGILKQLASLADQEVRLAAGVEKEVRKLTNILHDVQAVLEDAERRQVKEATVKLWLDTLKDVCYDMDDVLDEWNTAILKTQIEGDENVPLPERKVCSHIPSSCFSFRQVALRRDIAIKIKKLNDRLDVIANEKLEFNFTLMRGNEEVERQMTALVIDVSKVHGRDQDKKTIVDMLLSESSQGPTLRTISIVGNGGIGKTTLAQLVFDDVTVKAHFQERIWVCVPDPFDRFRIAKNIFEALKDKTPDLDYDFELLLYYIRQSIKGKKFLLVLDDVWTEDYKQWEQLEKSLKSGSSGSRILVTTRKEKVADIMKTTDMFRLGQLSNEECWSLFSPVAFFGRSGEESEKLESIGRKIVDKCNGLPLAAEILGSLLRFKNTREEWQSVLDSEVWELEKVERSLFPPLLLSYYDLSSTMRRCFSYCAIFPKDYNIEKDKLIKLWMAQGYLRETPSKDMEMVGEECFENLAMRSFFQDFEEDDGTIRYKMHDIKHDFAQFLTADECFVMEVNSPEQQQRLDFSHKARHSMMVLAERVSIPASIFNLKNLRSLIVEYKKPQLTRSTLSKVFDQLTCLRALEFVNCDHFGFSLMELPREIGKLIHLRHLNLTNNKELENLPETICELYNLRILNVSRCRGLRNLPHGLGKLVNLQTLNVVGCRGLRKLPHGLGELSNLRYLEIVLSGVSFMPKGVERLTFLRTLDTFYVSSAGNVFEASTLKDLEKLNNLGGYLEIRGLGEVRDVNEAKKAQLKNKELIGLGLDFGWKKVEGRKINDKDILDALEPPPSLEELSIYDYRGISVFPSWMMSLTKLRKVQISKCENCEFLPPLGKLSSLESILIGRVKTKNLDAEGGMGRVKRVGIEFLGIEADVTSSLSEIAFLPELKHLCFQCMFEWEEWDFGVTRRMEEEEEAKDITTASTIMPHLQFLKISFCPKLKALPDQLLHTKSSLEVLEISFCPILELRYYKETEGEDWHKISHIPNIVINGVYVQKDGHLVTSEPRALPYRFLHSRSLEVLEISSCPILEERYYKKREGEDWPKISYIPNIVINGDYVQKDGRMVPSVLDSADATEPKLYEGSSSITEYHGYDDHIED